MTAYARPRDVKEALELRAQHPDWMVLAGGTDLMVNANHRPVPAGILDVWRVPGLGGITDSDVSLAEAGGAFVVGFHTVPESTARQHAERAGVEIKIYEVIYDLIDDVKRLMEGTLAPQELEKNQGFIEVRAVFKSSKFGNIAGCYVTEGSAFRNSKARLSRDGKLLYTGQIASLRREKDDVREVKAGFECGLTLKDWSDVKEGDRIETYEVSLVKRTLN